MQKKRLTALLLACSLVFGMSGVANATPTTQNNDEAAIKKVISSYMDERYSMLSTLSMDDDIDSYFLPDSKGAAKELENVKNIIEIEIEHNKLQKTDLSFKYDLDLNFDNVKINSDKANVSMTETPTVYYNCSNDDTPSKLGIVEHDIQLAKYNNQWYITQDNYENEWKDYIQEVKNSQGNDWTKTKNLIKKHSLTQLEQIQKSSNNSNNTTGDEINEFTSPGLNTITTYSYYSYNRNSAASYAVTWGGSINYPTWGDYTSMGGDCTNFASQCVKAGGVPFDSSGTNKWYWYSDSNRTASWTGVTYFRSYLLNNNSSSSSNYGVRAVSTVYDALDRGDIIQNIGSHTMVVDALVTSGGYVEDYYICQHTYNYSHVLLSTRPPSSDRAYIHIIGYYK